MQIWCLKAMLRCIGPDILLCNFPILFLYRCHHVVSIGNQIAVHWKFQIFSCPWIFSGNCDHRLMPEEVFSSAVGINGRLFHRNLQNLFICKVHPISFPFLNLNQEAIPKYASTRIPSTILYHPNTLKSCFLIYPIRNLITRIETYKRNSHSHTQDYQFLLLEVQPELHYFQKGGPRTSPVWQDKR